MNNRFEIDKGPIKIDFPGGGIVEPIQEGETGERKQLLGVSLTHIKPA